MSMMEEDNLVASLSQEGPQFESNWAHFLFNIELALRLKEKNKEDVMAVLTAGGRWNGTGWNTGRASKVLWDLSGVGIVKSQIDHYRDCWLYAVALMCQVELPQVELPTDVAEAAFSLVGYVEHPEAAYQPAQPPQPVQETYQQVDSDEEPSFPWDAPTVALPSMLTALWTRASDPSKKVPIKNLLEAYSPLEGLPQRPPDNNLLPEYRKKQDTHLRVLSQQLLNVLRIWSHKFRGQMDTAVELQLWQYVAEVYHHLQGERKDLSVPGSAVAQSSSSSSRLFTEEDVKMQRQQQQLTSLNKKGPVFHQEISVGGFSPASVRRSFPVVTGGKGGKAKPFGTGYGKASQWHYPRYQVPIKGSNYGGYGRGAYSGGKGTKGGRGRGIPPSQPSQCDTKGHSQGGIDRGQGGRPIGQCGSTTQVTNVSSLVERTCPPVCDKSHHPGGRTQVSGPTTNFPETEKVRGGNSIGFRSHSRIREGGGSQGSGPKIFNLSGSLVCDFQNRGRENKTQTHQRLQGNKSKSVPPKIQIGPLEGNFSSAGTQNVGNKNRSAKRVLSSPPQLSNQKIYSHGNRVQNFSDGGSLFWSQHPTLPVDASDARVLEKMEKNGTPSLHLLGRHSSFGQIKNFGSKANQGDAAGFIGKWHANQSEKISAGTGSRSGSFGIPSQLKKGALNGSPAKIENCPKRIGKIPRAKRHVMPKGCSNFGATPKFSHCPPLSKGLFRPLSQVHGSTQGDGLGQENLHPLSSAKPGEGNRVLIKNLGGEVLQRHQSTPKNLVRFQHPRVGGNRPNFGKISPRILEKRDGLAYQHKGTQSIHSSRSKFGTPGGNRVLVNRQSSSLQLPKKGWGEIASIQQFNATLSSLVLPKQNKSGSKLGAFGRNVGRPIKSVGKRPRGLHPKKINIPENLWPVCQQQILSHGGHVCKPGEQPTQKIRLSVAALSSHSSKCIGMQPGKVRQNICQPPLETDFALVDSVEEDSSASLSDRSALLGWDTVVAPVSQVMRQKFPRGENRPSVGTFLQLPGGGNAPPPGGPFSV